MWRRALNVARASKPNELVALDPPRPKSLPIFGTTLQLMLQGGYPYLHKYADTRHRQLGPVFQENLGPVNVVFVSEPTEMRKVFSLEGRYPAHVVPEAWIIYNKMYGAKRGLFFMDGEEWLKMRRIMNRLMLKDSENTLLPPCQHVARHFADRWQHKADCEVQHLDTQLYQWSLQVILAVLLEDKYTHCRKLFENDVTNFSAVVQKVFQTSAKLGITPKLAAKYRLPAWNSFVSAVDDTIHTANKLVMSLISECEGKKGLLGALLAEKIDHTYVVRIVADLIMAAGDTTAYTMQWVFYLLAQHPEVQERLYEELKGIEGAENVIKLPLLKGVMREALRLYPVAPFLTRFLPQDCVLGGYKISSGQLIVMSLYTSGRDGKHFPEPDVFKPERWCRNQAGTYRGVENPYASLPFAMGARSCVGRKIAESQILLTLAEVVKRFKLSLVDTQPVEMVLELVAVPSKPIRLHLAKRWQ